MLADSLCEAAARVRALSAEAWGPGRAIEMVGEHPAFVSLLSKIEKVASFDEPVLILGESGSGKEGIAQAIYLLSQRRGRQMVSVNCPQYLEGNLTVSELFGHRKGSFTGATADRKGCFETADGGVIFLDEIGDLHMSAQVMLLRALANGEFQPLGADFTRRVNVRVVAATNRPLDALTVSKEFRHDLFFRLRYFLLKVPPLRDRGGDWFLLTQHVLEKLTEKYGVEKRLSPDSIRVLEGYKWPGNVRELMSVVTMGYALADGGVIEPDDFLSHLEGGAVENGNRRIGDDLYRRIVEGGETFKDAVYTPFMERDLNRRQVRELVAAGLKQCDNSYRDLLELFRIPALDYQRFMDFLRHHDLKP